MPTTKPMIASSKVKASERLEEDAQAMEERLVQLRMKMLEDKQRLERERPAKFGGSRWRSAQEGLGTVSRYAKDVEAKMKQPKKAPKGKPDSDAPQTMETRKKKTRKTANDVTPTVLAAVTVTKWTSQQVVEWLSSLGLDEFCSAFEFHQVTGKTLLTMTMDELIGIGVTRLSSRNLIWTELERIKQAAQAAANGGALTQSEIIDSKLRDGPLVPEMTAPLLQASGPDGSAKVHWSHIAPLKESNAVANTTDAAPVNLADGDFDEEASHASFMKALLEWRGGVDNTHEITKDDGLWHNPLAENHEEEEEHQGAKGGALWDGEYDEAREHAAFAQAVEAWRRAGV
ncbi:hypothetical protein ATCC90586_000871 [Pythium insidiosum]|nr:hypothetical protein ATCC90586_000871 [Pythium insidiosum]